jgi:hypothetical protein
VVSEGCSTDDPLDCPDLRGGLFDPSASSTWVQKGIYNLPLASEEIWGFSGNGQFGYDDVVLSYAGGQGPQLNNTIVGGIATKDFFVGTLGLTPYGVNFTDFNYPVPSILTSLKNAGYIESNSWGYTAGAYYTPKQSYGSLTFGGYDASRFIPNNLTITRGPDISRDLLIGIQTISSGPNSLLPSGIIAMIDSTVAQIWLPLEACLRFEEVFGITWNEEFNLYLVNETLHAKLVADNPTITLTLGDTTTSSNIINIQMPYGSFDLTASWPLFPNGTSRYFPLRRADNSSQYLLGRAFLQQASVPQSWINMPLTDSTARYLIVDYDRNTFSVSQALFPDTDVAQDLIVISSPSQAAPKGKFSIAVVAGIAVGAVTLLGILVTTIVLWKRRRHVKALNTLHNNSEGSFFKPELDSNETNVGIRHLSQIPPLHQIPDAKAVNSSEIDGQQKPLAEADGRPMLPRELHSVSRLPPELVGGSKPLLELAGSAGATEMPVESSRGRFHPHPRLVHELP